MKHILKMMLMAAMLASVTVAIGCAAGAPTTDGSSSASEHAQHSNQEHFDRGGDIPPKR